MRDVIVTVASVVLGIALAAMVLSFEGSAKGMADYAKERMTPSAIFEQVEN